MSPAPAAVETPPKFDPNNPLPGFYENVPEDVYRAAKGWNQSALKDRRSPRHVHAARYGKGKEPTKQMIIGRAVHYRALEEVAGRPSKLLDAPINPKTGEPFGPTSKAYAEFVADNPGMIVLGTDMRATVEACTASLLQNTQSRALLERDGPSEATLIWRDDHDVLCKCRIDRVLPELPFDLKTIDDASDEGVSRAIATYGYGFQAEWYSRGLRANGRDGRPFGFIFVENSEPYGVVVRGIGAKTQAQARDDVDSALAMIGRCEAANNWPCYPETIEMVEAPTWWLIRKEEGYAGQRDAA